MTKNEYEMMKEMTRKLDEVIMSIYDLMHPKGNGCNLDVHHLVQLLAQYCESNEDCSTCEFEPWCNSLFKIAPYVWPEIMDD